jgi:uncharacterized protein YjbI with pentapeptide repeats
MATRLSYDLSCARLREIGLLSHDEHPPVPDRLPQHDDEEPLGVNVFRTQLNAGLDLAELTLPRTFFGRSEINQVSFQNSDLHESNLCWNDFIGTDFRGADLAGSDMRSSLFRNVLFVGSNLNGTDLRRSSFIDCNFELARMKGARLTRQQGTTIRLSDAQMADISWCDESGPEPGGG